MNKKELKQKINEIKSMYESNNENEAFLEIENLLGELHSEEKYKDICDIFHTELGKQLANCSFEVAYSLNECGYYEESEQVYKNVLEINEDNAAVLNNLSNLLKRKGKYSESFKYILRAKELDPDDEIIDNNFVSLKAIIDEIKDKEDAFKKAIESLSKENKYVLNKLKCFITNSKKDNEFNNYTMPIPNWKFKVLMQTDDIKAESLKKQWLRKNYIIRTEKRKDGFVIIYEINPFIEKAIDSIKSKEINKKWLNGIENISVEKIESLGYYEIKQKINRINKKYKNILLRDYDELILNYLFDNFKSVIILSGSFIETLLMYYCCEKKKIRNISYSVNNRTVNKVIYDTNLGDLLQYFEQNRIFPKQIVHLGNVSRLFRNFIHPGKELKEIDNLDKNKSEICLLSVHELLKVII